MRVLFIGGTGIISTACTQLAAQRGLDLTLLTRGRHGADLPPGVCTLRADIDDPASASAALASRSFDAVVDFIAFTPAHIERDLALFRGCTRQYVFISSASAYQKPAADYLITESTPLCNPFWQYSRDKIACEELLLRAYRDGGFPVTIVRPSLTYGDTQIPLVLNSWAKPYTIVDRLRRGLELIVPGDGSSLWTITHNSDFAQGLVGLLGHAQAIGHAFHITSDEVLTWNQFFRLTAAAAGVEPRLLHIPSDFIAACLSDKLGTLLGDKSNSTVFDNSKIKRFVPTFRATVPFSEGIRRSLAWFDLDPARQEIDADLNAAFDKLIAAWHAATRDALRLFQS
jgi:nucleoside-diphosphate-sugar epimerase